MSLEAKQALIDEIADLYFDKPSLYRLLFPEMFFAPFSGLHQRIFDVISSTKHRKRLALAPRGIGKTSIVKGKVMEDILMREKHFIVYVSKSARVAEMQTENIKHALISNPIIRRYFGNVKEHLADAEEGDFTYTDEMDDDFSKSAWVAFGNTLILPRGCRQQLRGLNWRNYRPDLLIFDDPEDAKELGNPDIREKNREWFMADAFPSIRSPEADDRSKGEIIYIDTLKHYDAFPVTITKMSDWEWIRLSLCDDNLKSLAPRFVSDAEIAEDYENYKKAGTLDAFYREFRNIPRAPETAAFKPEYFQYYDESRLTPYDVLEMRNVVLIDSAKTVDQQSCDSAIVGVGLANNGKVIRVRQVIADKLYPDQIYQASLEMALRLGADAIGVETTGLEEFIMYPFQRFLNESGVTGIELVPLKARRKKEDRIAGLVPLYRSRSIWHNQSLGSELEQQLLSFPDSARVDVIDALAYLIEFLDMGSLVSMPGSNRKNVKYGEKLKPLPLEYGMI